MEITTMDITGLAVQEKSSTKAITGLQKLILLQVNMWNV